MPISVVVPLSTSRRTFFDDLVRPLLHANNPAEIIVVDREAPAPEKRNDGLAAANQPYVFFCDDDILLPATLLGKLHGALHESRRRNDNVAFAYCGYLGLVTATNAHPMNRNFFHRPPEFDASVLQRANFVSTMSLFRRDVFPGFDESLRRFQDWDVALTLSEQGYEGVRVEGIEFHAYYMEPGITSSGASEAEARDAVERKHAIGRHAR